MSSSAIKSKRSGFTLIELLVVIAIIAILAAILFPVFAKAREKARQTSCLSQTKQLGLGFIQYYQDYDEKLPAGSQNDTTQTYLTKPGLGWAGQIYSEVKSASIYKCPDDSTGTVAAAAPINAQVPVSYGFNANAAGQTQATYGNVAKSILLFETVGNQADVTTPGSTASATAGDVNSAAGDGQLGYTAATGAGTTPSTVGLLGGTANETTPSPTAYATGYLAGSGATTTGTTAGAFATATGRHTDGSNYLLADGHSKWFRNSSVSAGINNTITNDCGPAATTFAPTGTAGTNSSASTGCADGRLGGTFSVN